MPDRDDKNKHPKNKHSFNSPILSKRGVDFLRSLSPRGPVVTDFPEEEKATFEIRKELEKAISERNHEAFVLILNKMTSKNSLGFKDLISMVRPVAHKDYTQKEKPFLLDSLRLINDVQAQNEFFLLIHTFFMKKLRAGNIEKSDVEFMLLEEKCRGDIISVKYILEATAKKSYAPSDEAVAYMHAIFHAEINQSQQASRTKGKGFFSVGGSCKLIVDPLYGSHQLSTIAPGL